MSMVIERRGPVRPVPTREEPDMSTKFDRFAGRPRTRVAALLACAPLLLAGCGGDNTARTSAAVNATTSGSATQTSATSPAVPASTAMTATTVASPTSPGGSATTCSFGGATTAPVDTSLSQMTVTGVRAGQQDCFDRLVIDLAGDSAKKPGYQVRYVSQVRQDGSGKPVVLRGGAFLTVVVGAPSYDASGQPTYLPADATELVDVTGYASLRQVAWAGSFEGMTTIGVGVREQLPFKASIIDDGGKTRLVLDVAHSPT